MKNKSPKYAFFYLLSLAALIFMSIFLAVIVFQIIDKNIFDALSLSNIYGNQSSLRFAISALLISSPVFFLCAGAINKGLKKNELDKDSAIRNWLTYFILAVSAVVILGSFVGIVNNFLSGEMTLKSGLQLLTVIVIAALVFSFYFYDIRRENVSKKDKVIKIFFFSAVGLVAIVFISAWFLVESPKTARDRKFDDILLNNISSVESYVNSYYEETKTLPEDLDVLKTSLENVYDSKTFLSLLNGGEIQYNKIDDKKFELCASFRTDSYESQRNPNWPVYKDDSMKVYIKGWNCFKGNLWIEDKTMEKFN